MWPQTRSLQAQQLPPAQLGSHHSRDARALPMCSHLTPYAVAPRSAGAARPAQPSPARQPSLDSVYLPILSFPGAGFTGLSFVWAQSDYISKMGVN